MDITKYIGMDVHKEATTDRGDERGRQAGDGVDCGDQGGHDFAVRRRAAGRGLYVTFEEGTWAAWLYDLAEAARDEGSGRRNPRKNALLKAGNKSDRIDARKLAEMLRGGSLSAVYHGETGLRTLKELAQSYL